MTTADHENGTSVNRPRRKLGSRRSAGVDARGQHSEIDEYDEAMAGIPVSLVPEVDDPLSVLVMADGSIGPDDVRFVVDTGARTSLVPLVSATRDLTSKRRSTAVGAADTAAGDDVVDVPELHVGDLVALDVEADRADLGATRHPLLGIDVLGRHRCLFRLADGMIDLDVAPPNDVDVHPLDPDPSGLPFVAVDFAKTIVHACWDTGASRSVVDVAWARQHPDLVTSGELLSGRDSAGLEIEALDAQLAPCLIGGVRFEVSACVIVDLSSLSARLERPLELIVGAPIIQAATWWFNFPEHRWAVGARVHG